MELVDKLERVREGREARERKRGEQEQRKEQAESEANVVSFEYVFSLTVEFRTDYLLGGNEHSGLEGCS
jgi:hypothetical protein